jgi:hypothetical protein
VQGSPQGYPNCCVIRLNRFLPRHDLSPRQSEILSRETAIAYAKAISRLRSCPVWRPSRIQIPERRKFLSEAKVAEVAGSRDRSQPGSPASVARWGGKAQGVTPGYRHRAKRLPLCRRRSAQPSGCVKAIYRTEFVFQTRLSSFGDLPTRTSGRDYLQNDAIVEFELPGEIKSDGHDKEWAVFIKCSSITAQVICLTEVVERFCTDLFEAILHTQGSIASSLSFQSLDLIFPKRS